MRLVRSGFNPEVLKSVLLVRDSILKSRNAFCLPGIQSQDSGAHLGVSGFNLGIPEHILRYQDSTLRLRSAF